MKVKRARSRAPSDVLSYLIVIARDKRHREEETKVSCRDTRDHHFRELIRAVGEKQPPSDKIAREKCIRATKRPFESFLSSSLPPSFPRLSLSGLRFIIENASRLGSRIEIRLWRTHNRDEIREANPSGFFVNTECRSWCVIRYFGRIRVRCA